MNRRKKIGITAVGVLGAFVLLLCLCSIGAEADTDTDTVTVTAVAAPTIQLSMSADVDWGSISTPLAAGNVVAYTDTTVASVSSNKNWNLIVHKDHDLQWNTDTIPSTDLTYGVTSSDPEVQDPQASGTEFGTSASPTNVCGGATPCTRGANLSVTVTYSLLMPWTAEADQQYTATHTYTAVQP